LIVGRIAEGRIVIVVSVPQGVSSEGFGVTHGGSPLVFAGVDTNRNALADGLFVSIETSDEDDE